MDLVLALLQGIGIAAAVGVRPMLPVLLAGGASGQLQGGRHLVYPPQTPMANLLLAMLHKLGAPVASIGDSTEPLAI